MEAYPSLHFLVNIYLYLCVFFFSFLFLVGIDLKESESSCEELARKSCCRYSGILCERWKAIAWQERSISFTVHFSPYLISSIYTPYNILWYIPCFHFSNLAVLWLGQGARGSLFRNQAELELKF